MGIRKPFEGRASDPGSGIPVLPSWPKGAPFVLVDHMGERALDAAAYFAGHGFTAVRALAVGRDAWFWDVDPTLLRYEKDPAPWGAHLMD